MEKTTVKMGEHDDVYRLSCIASGANEVARIVEEGLDPEDRKRQLEKALKNVHLSVSPISGNDDVTAPVEDVHTYCSLYGITFDRSAIARSLNQGREDTEGPFEGSMGKTSEDAPVDPLASTKSWFSIPITAGESHVFNIALSEQRHLFVGDSTLRPTNIQARIPPWLVEHFDRPVAIGALPLHIKKISIGLIYLEGEKGFFANVPQNYLNYLKILHQQAVLAIRQR